MTGFVDEIRFLAGRGLWETQNLIACIPDELWEKRYDGIPMWKYVYHMLYSMDRWYMNPKDPGYRDPSFHQENLADLNVVPTDAIISREEMTDYLQHICQKITKYNDELTDDVLLQKPIQCEYTRFRLILGQFRHWHRHMGIVYGFLIKETGRWPYVLNMQGSYPEQPMPNYYET